MCAVANRSLGVYQNGGYGSHVVAPHPRHLVDPGTLDPAVAATYACSGITVYSAIKTLDERLTSAQANRVLIQGNVRRDQRKENVDKMAAAILLQSYLDGI